MVAAAERGPRAALRFAAFDIETSGDDSTFVSGAAFADGVGIYFTDPLELIEHLRRLGRKGYTLTAHNAEFDVVNLLWRYGEDVTVHVHQASYTCAYWRCGGKRHSVQIWDSQRLAAGLALEQLGEAISCPKFATPQLLLGRDPDRFAWFCELHDQGECVECYNVRDAEIAWRFMTMFAGWVEPMGLALKRTLPSLAYDLWAAWDSGKQAMIHSRPARQLARNAYQGTRCEVFKYGSIGPVHTYDIRAQFCAIMATADFPDCSRLTLSARYDGPSGLEGVEGVFEAVVYQPEAAVPVLAARIGSQLVYGVGTIAGTWTAPELRAAFARGVELLEYGAALTTTYTCRPFEVTAFALLARREEYRVAGSPLEVLPKMLGNALAGRLGMDDNQERHVIRKWSGGLKPADYRSWQLESTDRAVYLTRHQVIPRPAPGGNVLWAAYITSLSRLQLLEHLEAAGAGLVYCDADSVHSTTPLTTFGDHAGQLRETGDYDVSLYLGPKLYRLEAYSGEVVVRAKGVPRRYAERYLLTGDASYQTALGVVKGLAVGAEPGAWIDVERVRHVQLAGRQLLNPRALRERDQVSETEPLSLALDGPFGREARIASRFAR